MPLTLGLDTSGPYVGGTLCRDGIVLDAFYEDMAKGQAEHLMPMAQALLHNQGFSWTDLDRLGVGVGPGNFTGIRISVSAVRGLAMALKVPAIGVTLHNALAFRIAGRVRTVISARRNYVYIQDFQDGLPLGPTALHALDKLPARATDNIVGPMAADAEQGEFILQAPHAPAAAIALVAETSDDLTAPSPLYIRPPDAAPPKEAAPVILDQ